MVLSTIRASSLDRVLSCPGSLTVNAIVAPRDGDDGDEGTACHWSSHWRIQRELGAGGDIGPRPAGSYPASQWISDYYVRHVMETVPADYTLECEAALAYEFSPATEPREITVVDWVNGRPNLSKRPYGGFILSGHIDCLALSPCGRYAIGWDLKTGYDPVDCANSNWQILGYCVLLKRAYPSLQSVTFYIVQPRNDEDEGYERVSVVTITNLGDAVALLADRITDAISKPLELNTTIKGCRFCVGCSCPAIRALQENMKLTMTEEALNALDKTPDDALLASFVIDVKTLAQPSKDALALINDRMNKVPRIVADDGTIVTRSVQNGSWTVKDPVAFYDAICEVLPQHDQRARATKPRMTELKNEIAAAMKIPKTSAAGVSAQSVFESRFAPLAEQGTRNILHFSQ